MNQEQEQRRPPARPQRGGDGGKSVSPPRAPELPDRGHSGRPRGSSSAASAAAGRDKQQASPTPEHAKQPRTERLPERASLASARGMFPGGACFAWHARPPPLTPCTDPPSTFSAAALVTTKHRAAELLAFRPPPLRRRAAAAARLERLEAGRRRPSTHPPVANQEAEQTKKLVTQRRRWGSPRGMRTAARMGQTRWLEDYLTAERSFALHT